MLFTSLNFIFFFLAVILIYYLLPTQQYRRIFLLISSYFFYACFSYTMLLLLIAETFVVYFYGRLHKRHPGRGLCITATCTLLLPLLFYKYVNFFAHSISDLLALQHITIVMPTLQFIVPIGISFYTFMAVSYVIDVYTNRYQADPKWIDVALFLGFFPHITSGPIARANQLIPQYKQKSELNYHNLSAGAKMMLWGYFMKLVVGDRAGIYVNAVFGQYEHHNGISLLLATFMYTIQIYCDFAGYSLIAIGSAKAMGYNLIENFRRPYFSLSVADFWRKWHISLSTWFRDYIYIPCGGSRMGTVKTYRNLLITFLVSGLWHGAAYNFVVWGLYHGMCQVVGKILSPIKQRCQSWLHISDHSYAKKIWDIVITFCLVAYGWMLFYAPNWQFIVGVTKGYAHIDIPYIHPTSLFFFGIGFIILFIKDLTDEFFPTKYQQFMETHQHFAIIWHYVAYSLLAVLIVWIGVLGGGQFIYFKF